jgi:branched-chain amino acid transport system permease protein
MFTILNILIDGIAYGMILFMISVGLSITMGLMRVINLAHGGFALLGGVFVNLLMQRAGMAFVPAAFLSVLGVIGFAIPIERIFYRRIYGLGELEQVLATIGFTFLIIASVNYVMGSSLIPIHLPGSLSGTIDFGFRVLPFHRLVVIVAGILSIVALYALIEKTRFGIYLRASVDNRKTAAALGIDTSKVFSLTFGLGAALAAAGGILGAELLPIEAYYPLRYMILVLLVVSIGGMGSIAGSFCAALGIGIFDTALRYIFPEIATVFFYLVFMGFLAFRPNGLMGKT